MMKYNGSEMPSPVIPDPSGARVAIRDAVFPKPFPNELEFNAPVHETWNIVHIGMLVPEAHQIYICSDNCMRGVVMTAAEMNALDRFSCVVLQEHDLYDGNLEEITLEGVSDVIRKLRLHGSGRPRAVLVFPVCLHHFTGCDLGYVYRELEKRFPDIDFIRCWMDPIMQKTGPTPDYKERKAVMDVLGKRRKQAAEEKESECASSAAVLLGDIFALDPESELMQIINAANRGRRADCIQIQDCSTYDQFLSLADSPVIIARSPAAEAAAGKTAHRLGRQFLYLPPSFSYEEIAREMIRAAELLQPADNTDAAALPDRFQSYIEECETALKRARNIIGATPVAIDYIAVPRPLGLARLLLEHSFCVKEIYLDAISAEEEEDFRWLQKNAPELELCCTNHVKGRVLHGAGLRKLEEAQEGTVRYNDAEPRSDHTADHSRYLAIGPKAAWFCGTGHFVNLVDYGGMWGFSGICKLTELMIDAFENEKDTRSIVPRKGLGCACVL